MDPVDPNSFVAGVRLQRNGQILVVHGCATNGIVKLANHKLKTTQYLPKEQLADGILRGQIVLLARENDEGETSTHVQRIAADLSTYPIDVQDAAKRSLAYVRAVHKEHIVGLSERSLRAVIAKTASAISDGKPPSWRTVIRWIKRFDQRQVAGLIHIRRGNTHGRLDDDVEDLIYIAITTHYMTFKGPALKDTHLHLQGVIARENALRDPIASLTEPSYKALRHRLREFDPFELLAARLGPKYALNWARTRGMAPKATRVLEVVQMDHTVFDAEVIFRGVLRLGRPTLTIARDQFSGAIVGLYLGFEPANYQCVMECMESMILPKETLNAEFPRLVRIWAMHGIPETLLVDNGPEFRGLDLQNACHHLGIDLSFCPPRKPWFKPHVERLFGVLRQKFTNRLRGRTFTPREEKGDRNVKDEPLIDLDDLRLILIKWIVDVFNEAPYGATGVPPRVMWEASVKDHPVRVDRTEDEVKVYCGRTARRSLRSYGIEIIGLIYASDDLSNLRRFLEKSEHYAGSSAKRSRKVLIKYDPRDLSRIWVLDSIVNEYIAAEAVNKAYAKNLSLHRHRLNVRYARLKNKGVVDTAALVQASAEIDELIAALSITDAERLGSALARAIREEKPDAHDIDAEIREDGSAEEQLPTPPAEAKLPPPTTTPAPTPPASESAEEMAADCGATANPPTASNAEITRPPPAPLAETAAAEVEEDISTLARAWAT